jgi:hypothetical protein
MLSISSTLRRSLLALALSACAGSAFADSTLHVELNTAGYGNDGYIDLTFSGSPLQTVASYADLSNFVGFSNSANDTTSGAVTGSLATGYRIGNPSSDYNEVFHAVNFAGGKVSFDVTFSGAVEPSANYSSMFGVFLFASDGATVLGNSSNPDGSLLALSWTPATTVGGQGLASSTVFVTSGVTVAAVPEPSTWAMLGAGLALVGLARRRKLSA